jgi:hypothetical protein
VLAFRMNPMLDAPAAQAAIDAQIEQAYQKTRIANAAQGAADLLRQNIMINLVQDTGSLIGQKLDDPASVMIATARANATASTNASFLTMGRIAEQALPLVRNVIEAIIYAIFPFVFLLFMLAHGRGLGLAIRSFVLSMVWIQLWPPLYAVLNYVATLASARTLQAASRMDAGTNGLALDTAASIYQGAISDQAIAGYMVISIPIIATAIIKGGEVAFQAIAATGPIQSAASAESNQTTKGNITQDAVSLDQQQLAPNRTSAFMSQQHRRPRHHHPGHRTRHQHLPVPGHHEPPRHHLHLQRAPGLHHGRERPRSRDARQHRTRRHAAQPERRPHPRARHPGILRPHEAAQRNQHNVGRGQHIDATPDAELDREASEQTARIG